MKSIVSFILGFIAGVGSLLLLALVIHWTDEENRTMFETPGECISTSKMQVIQVIDENSAIAYEVEYNDVLKKDCIKSDGIIVLVTNDNDNVYYDEQIVNLPSGKCFRQVGVYKYTAKSGMNKTVPIVKIIE